MFYLLWGKKLYGIVVCCIKTSWITLKSNMTSLQPWESSFQMGYLYQVGARAQTLCLAPLFVPLWTLSWFLCSWDFLGKNKELGCRFLLQEFFPTQGSNPHLLHCSGFFTAETPGKPIKLVSSILIFIKWVDEYLLFMKYVLAVSIPYWFGDLTCNHLFEVFC